MSVRIRRGEEVSNHGLVDRTVAVLGFGNQGAAHAANLRDSGVAVVVGARAGVGFDNARAAGFDTKSIAEATAASDLVILALPDEAQGAIFRSDIQDALRTGQTLGFIHGFAIHHGLIKAPENVGVVLVAPKGPGTTLREVFTQGLGIPCLFDVHQSPANSDAEARGLAWAHGIGCARAGVIDGSFADETETDLFGEQAVLCGGVAALIEVAFETLVTRGYPPELAYIECCHELKQVTDLIYTRGLAGMNRAISNTAEFGAYEAKSRLSDDHLRAHFSALLDDIQSGQFGKRMIEDHAAGGALLAAERAKSQASPIEQTGRLVRSLMPWLT